MGLRANERAAGPPPWQDDRSPAPVSPCAIELQAGSATLSARSRLFVNAGARQRAAAKSPPAPKGARSRLYARTGP